MIFVYVRINRKTRKQNKTIENSKTTVNRQATPTIRYNENIVEVKYTVNVKDKQTGHSENLSEVHKMRLFLLSRISGVFRNMWFFWY